MQHIEDLMLSRWRYGESFAPAKAAMERALDFHRKIRAKSEEVSANRTLSALGRKDAMRDFIVDHAHEMIRAKKSVEAFAASIAKRRSELQPPPSDKSDVAAAVLRSEMRQMLRVMKPAERKQAIFAADPTMMAAVIEAPNIASGIDDDDRNRILARLIEEAHPGELRQLEAADSAIELLNAAVRVAQNTACAAAEFPNETIFASALSDAVGSTTALDADIERQFVGVMENAA